MKLEDFRDLLLTACPNVSHYRARGKGFPRVVYAEAGRTYYRFDNRAAARTWEVDVHVYTREEFDPIVERLEDAFDENNVPFDMTAAEYGAAPTDPGDPSQEGVMYYRFRCEV